MSYKYPTREQAERIASSECDTELCHECDIMRWCTSDTMDPTSASRACGASMLAMHDEIDRMRAEREGQCRWAIDDSLGEHNVWVTDCGNAFVLSDGGPEANEMRFCPLCGKALVEVEVESDGEV